MEKTSKKTVQNTVLKTAVALVDTLKRLTVQGGPTVHTFPVSLFRSKRSGQVLYLEAGKDFVDTLLSLLLLPVGTIIRVLSAGVPQEQHYGAISSIYKSVEKLDSELLHVDRDILLEGPYYLQRLDDLEEPVDEYNLATGTGFVKDNITFIVTDKLKIMRSATIEIMSVLKEMKVNSLDDLESKKITVTITQLDGNKLVDAAINDQVLQLFGSALTSNSCLNNVFGTGETSRIPGKTSSSDMHDATAKQVRELLIPCD